MTEPLERLWDEIPAGTGQPVNRILRAGKAAQPKPRARRVLRPVTTFGVLAGLAGAFVAGTVVGQPTTSGPGAGPGPGTPPGAPTVAAAFHGDLQPAASCAELLDHYVEEALDRVGPYGWETGYYGDVVPLADDLVVRQFAERDTVGVSHDLAKAPAPVSQRSESSATGTNVQEAGVDEPDVVKTDGSLLVRLKDATLTTYDVSGEEVDELGSVDLGDFEDGEILLAGDTVVAVGDDGTRRPSNPYYDYDPDPTSPMTRVVTIDVSEPGDPGVLDTVDYDSALVTARQHGDDVRLVLAAGLPELDFVRPGRGTGQQSAREANERIVSDTTLDDWLPHVTTGGGISDQLVECPNVAIPEADLGLDTMAVVGFPADDPGELDAIGLAGAAPLAYESPDHLYLATQGFPDFCFTGRVSEAGTTQVYDFEVDGTAATYIGSGEVEGSVADRWAMDEYDGVLRLAVGPTSETGNFNSLVTLRAEGDELVEIGRVDELGVNEQIEAVRWFDSLAIVVTFRQVDPLYAIDLTDASKPRLMGQLKIPGFSEYLHPLGEHRLVGVGQGPGERGRWAAQAGLFNVNDLTRPRRLDVVTYAANTTAQAGGDPRQFTWLPGVRTVLTVIARGFNGRTGWVSVLSLGEGQMSNRMVQVEYGSDIDEVRLVPLPEDRVVLVTGDDVEFFDL